MCAMASGDFDVNVIVARGTGDADAGSEAGRDPQPARSAVQNTKSNVFIILRGAPESWARFVVGRQDYNTDPIATTTSHVRVSQLAHSDTVCRLYVAPVSGRAKPRRRSARRLEFGHTHGPVKESLIQIKQPYFAMRKS